MNVLHVPSIHCSACEEYITTLLASLPIGNLVINLENRSVAFSVLKEAPSDETQLLDHVQELLGESGYEVQVLNTPKRDDWLRRLRNRLGRRDARRRARHRTHCPVCREDQIRAPARSSSSEKGKEVDRTPLERIQVSSQSPTLQKTKYSIDGMTCSSCTSTITSLLLGLTNVVSASVNLTFSSAEVIHDSSAISAEAIRDAIESVGYGAEIVESSPIRKRRRQAVFGIEGMTCTACVTTIEQAIGSMPSVDNVSLSLIHNTLKFSYDPSLVSKSAIIDTIGDQGYDATEWEDGDVGDSNQIKNERTVTLEVEGMFCMECPKNVTAYLSSLPLLSYTPLTFDMPRTTITYVPSRDFTMRHLLNIPKPFTAKIYHPPSLLSRSKELHIREARRLTTLFAIALLFAIPTFVIAIVGMTILPSSNKFRMWCETPLWGGANRSIIILWILATFVQFGVGSVFYERSFKGLKGSGNRRWRWSNLVHFGNMDLLVSLSTSVAYISSIAMMAIDVRTPRAVVGSESSFQTMTYFDSSVFLIFFILMGRVLEGRARVKTGDAISNLGKMRPEHALLITEEQSLEKLEGGLGSVSSTTITLDELELGDHILIRPGSIPPADGTVLYGSTTVDESSLTGESLPVTKQHGDALLSGTTNLTSAVVMSVDKLGDSTMLEAIVQAVSEAQGQKAPIERLADRVTSFFVPVVIWLSVVVLAVWLGVSLSGVIPDSFLDSNRTSTGDRVFFAFEFAIATLVVACPCGIGLAAPTAQAVGSGMAARAGILAQGGGEAFQLASAVDTVVFDKTGTLTTGDTVVVDSDDSTDAPIWLGEAIRALEEGSSHPLAIAIANYYTASGSKPLHPIRVLRSEEVPGKGVKGVIQYEAEEFEVISGNEGFVRVDNGAQGVTSLAEEWKSSGKSLVLVAISPLGPEPSTFKIVASLAISDTPRPEAADTVAKLKKSGKEVWMLSGDNPLTAKAVGRNLGIDEANVVAGVLPHEKSAFIKQLQERRRSKKVWWKRSPMVQKSVVAFCGDGLNDTAALETADVGIALSHGSQITLGSASFVLLSTSSVLASLPKLLQLSAKVYKRQKVNFAWAMIYNLCMLPLAAGVFYPAGKTRLPPVWSALAMALSSVSVVCSSLALKWGL